MGVFHPQSVELPEGGHIEVQLAHSVNVDRFPEIRDAILDGSFHRFVHPRTGVAMTAESSFLYVDFGRSCVFRVRPAKDRHLSREVSTQLAGDLAMLPESLLKRDGMCARVVFGLDELREKLIAQDAGIDDRIVELLKVYVLNDHPFLLHENRLRLYLHAVDDFTAEFVARIGHEGEGFSAKVPLDAVEEMNQNPGAQEAWVGQCHQENPFRKADLDIDAWVNFSRWSPRNRALCRLRSVALEVQAGRDPELDSRKFRWMLKRLPRGSKLPSWGRRALRLLFRYAKDNRLAELEDTLFQIRFDVDLEDEWSRNDDPDDIDTLWQLLRALPDSHVEGNVRLRKISLQEGGGGFYIPKSREISLGAGALAHEEKFADLVRHEVGHAVHAQREPQIDGWLRAAFGWQLYGNRRDDLEAWASAMPGYAGLSRSEQREVLAYLVTAMGKGGQWSPGPKPQVPAGHPWHAANFGPRLAYEQSGAYWYKRHRSWYRHGDKAYCINFWYARPMVVDIKTLHLIEEVLPSAYAAMSPKEFFAEFYAVYYDLDDPARAKLPADAVRWLDQHLSSVDHADLRPAPRSSRRPALPDGSTRLL